MIKSFEANIESFSETKGFFLSTHTFFINLPDNTTISRVNIIDTKEKTKYLCETVERLVEGG